MAFNTKGIDLMVVSLFAIIAATLWLFHVTRERGRRMALEKKAQRIAVELVAKDHGKVAPKAKKKAVTSSRARHASRPKSVPFSFTRQEDEAERQPLDIGNTQGLQQVRTPAASEMPSMTVAHRWQKIGGRKSIAESSSEGTSVAEKDTATWLKHSVDEVQEGTHKALDAVAFEADQRPTSAAPPTHVRRANAQPSPVARDGCVKGDILPVSLYGSEDQVVDADAFEIAPHISHASEASEASTACDACPEVSQSSTSSFDEDDDALMNVIPPGLVPPGLEPSGLPSPSASAGRAFVTLDAEHPCAEFVRDFEAFLEDVLPLTSAGAPLEPSVLLTCSKTECVSPCSCIGDNSGVVAAATAAAAASACDSSLSQLTVCEDDHCHGPGQIPEAAHIEVVPDIFPLPPGLQVCQPNDCWQPDCLSGSCRPTSSWQHECWQHEHVTVELAGLPNQLCVESFVNAMLEQAGLERFIIDKPQVARGKHFGQVWLTVINLEAALASKAHFDGRVWGGKQVTATISQAAEQAPSKSCDALEFVPAKIMLPHRVLEPSFRAEIDPRWLPTWTSVPSHVE